MAILTGDIKLDLIGLFVSLVVVLFAYFKWSFQYWKRRNIPYLPGTIPFGSIIPPYKKVLGHQFAEMYNDAKIKGISQNWKITQDGKPFFQLIQTRPFVV